MKKKCVAMLVIVAFLSLQIFTFTGCATSAAMTKPDVAMEGSAPSAESENEIAATSESKEVPTVNVGGKGNTADVTINGEEGGMPNNVNLHISIEPPPTSTQNTLMLQPTPFYEQGWFWPTIVIIGGIVLAGATAGFICGFSDRCDQQHTITYGR